MESGLKRPIAIGMGIVFMAAVGIVLVWTLAPDDAPPLPTGLTEVKDPAQIQELVQLSHLNIFTSTNYLGHRIYTARATLKNIFNSPVRLVDVELKFKDQDKKEILHQVHTAFGPKQRPLEPGTDYTFDIPFENPPRTWNYHVPDMEIDREGY
jgi:hypothetical protein